MGACSFCHPYRLHTPSGGTCAVQQVGVGKWCALLKEEVPSRACLFLQNAQYAAVQGKIDSRRHESHPNSFNMRPLRHMCSASYSICKSLARHALELSVWE